MFKTQTSLLPLGVTAYSRKKKMCRFSMFHLPEPVWHVSSGWKLKIDSLSLLEMLLWVTQEILSSWGFLFSTSLDTCNISPFARHSRFLPHSLSIWQCPPTPQLLSAKVHLPLHLSLLFAVCKPNLAKFLLCSSVGTMPLWSTISGSAVIFNYALLFI